MGGHDLRRRARRRIRRRLNGARRDPPHRRRQPPARRRQGDPDASGATTLATARGRLLRRVLRRRGRGRSRAHRPRPRSGSHHRARGRSPRSLTGTAALLGAGALGGVVLLACDLPFVEPALAAVVAAPPAALVVPVDASGRRQYVCARYGPAVALRAIELVGRGERVAAGRSSPRCPADDVVELTGLRARRPRRRRHRRPTPGGSGSEVPPVASTRDAPTPSAGPTTPARVRRVDRASGGGDRPDRLVTEEPMEIRVHGPGQEPRPLAVTMRTPGPRLRARGGLLPHRGRARHRADLADVALLPRPATASRSTTSSRSGCGGRSTSPAAPAAFVGQRELRALRQDDARPGRAVDCAPRRRRTRASTAPTLVALPGPAARRRRRVFDATGGLHARRAASTPTARSLAVPRGRRPAQRGRQARRARRARAAGCRSPTSMLVVSGRVSFEIVQKAARSPASP